MRKFILLFIILPMSLGLLADVGDSYRYKATLKLTDNREITGYFYFHTYEKGFNQAKTDFKTYILTYYHFPIKIYENIKTIEINQYLAVDFANEGSGITVKKSEIISLALIGELETEVGSRLIEVSKREFGLINQDFVYTESYYNESYAIASTFYFISWSGKNNLTEIKNEMAKNIDRLSLIENNEQSINKYIEKKRIELIEKGIVLFRYDGAV
jgi:hypothetical protein